MDKSCYLRRNSASLGYDSNGTVFSYILEESFSEVIGENTRDYTFYRVNMVPNDTFYRVRKYPTMQKTIRKTIRKIFELKPFIPDSCQVSSPNC
jgi:hypothetical protein